jgi:hypothetical protein
MSEQPIRGVPLLPHLQMDGGRFRAVTLAGEPVPGALLETFDGATGSPRAAFADDTYSLPHPTKLTAGPDGFFPALHAPDGATFGLRLSGPTGHLLGHFGVTAQPTPEEVR